MSAKSHLRMAAVAEINDRYAAIIIGLSRTIEEVFPFVGDAAKERLGEAVDDAYAQLTAAEDALDAAIADAGLLE